MGGYGYTTQQGEKEEESRHKLRKNIAAIVLYLH
jgi:hypothetical protein